MGGRSKKLVRMLLCSCQRTENGPGRQRIPGLLFLGEKAVRGLTLSAFLSSDRSEQVFELQIREDFVPFLRVVAVARVVLRHETHRAGSSEPFSQRFPTFQANLVCGHCRRPAHSSFFSSTVCLSCVST